VSEPQVPKRARHLMDPANPTREVRKPSSGSMTLEPVQKWVLSVLAATTIVHLAAGLVIAAIYVESDRTGAQIGLNILAGAFGVIAVAVFRAIHSMKMVSAWLLLGAIPTVVGLWLTFR
jgi:cytochrome b subunit of formate dehydrogenase